MGKNRDRLTEVVSEINQNYNQGIPFPTNKLAKVAGTSGKYTAVIKSNLIRLGIADIVRYKDGEYWLPIKAFVNHSEEELEKIVSEMRSNQEKEKQVESDALRKAIRKEYLNSRKILFTIPKVRCVCGTEIDLGPTYITGSDSSKKLLINSFLGSVDCPKCKLQVYFGVFNTQNPKYIQDKIFLEAYSKLGFSFKESIPEETNNYFSKLWGNLGESSKFKFK
jgi:hypothetical protein